MLPIIVDKTKIVSAIPIVTGTAPRISWVSCSKISVSNMVEYPLGQTLAMAAFLI